MKVLFFSAPPPPPPSHPPILLITLLTLRLLSPHLTLAKPLGLVTFLTPHPAFHPEKASQLRDVSDAALNSPLNLFILRSPLGEASVFYCSSSPPLLSSPPHTSPHPGKAPLPRDVSDAALSLSP